MLICLPEDALPKGGSAIVKCVAGQRRGYGFENDVAQPLWSERALICINALIGRAGLPPKVPFRTDADPPACIDPCRIGSHCRSVRLH